MEGVSFVIIMFLGFLERLRLETYLWRSMIMQAGGEIVEMSL